MKFTENKTKEIIYNHLVEYDLENFLKISIGQPLLLWTGGYLLSFTRYSLEEFEKQIMKHGKRVYDSIVYCVMPKYKDTVFDKYKNEYIILDDSVNSIHMEVAKWLDRRNNI